MHPHSITSLEDRFWSKVDKSGGPNACWLWKGRLTGRGYGAWWADGKNAVAHKVALALSGNPIPTGLVADHVCRNRLCVNPGHLRAVTARQNSLENSLGLPAINARKQTCSAGHPYDEGNTYLRTDGARCCQACQRGYERQYRDRLAGK